MYEETLSRTLYTIWELSKVWAACLNLYVLLKEGYLFVSLDGGLTGRTGSWTKSPGYSPASRLTSWQVHLRCKQRTVSRKDVLVQHYYSVGSVLFSHTSDLPDKVRKRVMNTNNRTDGGTLVAHIWSVQREKETSRFGMEAAVSQC